MKDNEKLEDKAKAAFDEIAAKYMERARTLKPKMMQGRQELGALFKAINHTIKIRNSAMWLGFVGGCLCFVGFVLWYKKVQRFQDIVLFNESNKNKS